MMELSKKIIIAALVISLILYLAGVFSGLYASKVYEQRTATSLERLQTETRQDIEILREGTREQIRQMDNYISFLENNIITIQLEQAFIETLDESAQCRFSNITASHLVEQLQQYRDRLPYRLELYERDADLSEEYELLKGQYNKLSIKTWILLRGQYHGCAESPVLALYLYSRDCEGCVRQGQALDLFVNELEWRDRDVLVFTVDSNADDQVLGFIKDYYGVNETPAIIMGDETMQGRVYSAQELLEAVR